MVSDDDEREMLVLLGGAAEDDDDREMLSLLGERPKSRPTATAVKDPDLDEMEALLGAPSPFDQPPPKFGEFDYQLKKPEIAKADVTRVAIKPPPRGLVRDVTEKGDKAEDVTGFTRPTEPAAMALEGGKTVQPMLTPTERLEGEGKGIRRTRKALEFVEEAAGMGLAFELAAPLGGLAALSKYPALASVIRNAAAGTGYGGVKEAAKGRGIKEVGKKAAIEGATWAALGPVFEILGAKGKAIFDKMREGKRLSNFEKEQLEHALKDAPSAEPAGGIERAAPRPPVTPITREAPPSIETLLLGPGKVEGAGFTMTGTRRPRTVYDPRVGMEVDLTGKPFRKPKGRPVRMQALTEEQKLQQAFESGPITQGETLRPIKPAAKEKARITPEDITDLPGPAHESPIIKRTPTPELFKGIRKGNAAAKLAKGEPISDAEVMQVARETSDPVYWEVMSREGKLKEAANNQKIIDQTEMLNDQFEALSLAGKVTPEMEKEFVNSVANHISHIEQQASASGFSLRRHRMEHEQLNKLKGTAVEKQMNLRKLWDEIETVQTKLGGNLAKIQEAWGKVDKKDYRAVFRFYRDAANKKLWNFGSEYRVTNMLSAIRTQGANAIGGLTMTVARATKKAAMASSDWLFRKPQDREHFFGEAAHQFKGLANLKDAFGDFVEGYAGRKFTGSHDYRQGSFFRDYYADRLGAKFGKPGQAVGRVFGEIQAAPLNMLNAVDNFVYTLNFGGEKAALAYKNEMRKALGKTALDDLVINQMARKAATKSLLKGELFEKGQSPLFRYFDHMTDAAYRLRKKFKPAGLLIPFVEVPSNFVKENILWLPGLGHAIGATSKGELKAEAMAAANLGTMVLLGGGILAVQGRLFFDYSDDPNQAAIEKKEGKTPGSVKIGDSWTNISQIPGASAPIMLAAAIDHQMRRKNPSDSELRAFSKAAVTAAPMVFLAFGNIPMLEGTKNVVEATTDIGKGKLGKPLNLAESMGRQYIPDVGMMRSLQQYGDDMFRKPVTFWQKVAMNFPGGEKYADVPPLYAKMGGPVPVKKGDVGWRKQANLVLPFRFSKDSGDLSRVQQYMKTIGTEPKKNLKEDGMGQIISPKLAPSLFE